MAAAGKAVKTTRVRKIDIGNWRSNVAKQYGIRQLPTWWYYDGKRLVTKDLRQVVMELGKGR